MSMGPLLVSMTLGDFSLDNWQQYKSPMTYQFPIYFIETQDAWLSSAWIGIKSGASILIHHIFLSIYYIIIISVV